jgi:hypothetical protein
MDETIEVGTELVATGGTLRSFLVNVAVRLANVTADNEDIIADSIETTADDTKLGLQFYFGVRPL